ncbi:pentapeptide repeat-containing protein [Achromobacter sp. LC458]|uniref:pentapeptide repeat-containing protein n=1 Tax=Achromobacter sp. LC458 TaxID=1120623 RepID=UPI00116BE19B|nr:pentapeptide repeat-containing protein [Achromobacter sp. LC458]
MPGSGIGGIRLRTTISAANSAISTVLWDFMALPIGWGGCARLRGARLRGARLRGARLRGCARR